MRSLPPRLVSSFCSFIGSRPKFANSRPITVATANNCDCVGRHQKAFVAVLDARGSGCRQLKMTHRSAVANTADTREKYGRQHRLGAIIPRTPHAKSG